MLICFKQLLRDESGLVISAELIMIVTIAVIGLTAGWGAVSTMLSEELEDVANSVGSLDQSYNYRGLTAWGHATCSGSGFVDRKNLVNVSTSSASVAGYGYTEIAPQYEVAEQEVLVEEEVLLNVQIDEVLLVQLVELGIVEIREDGAVILLREDLIEIQADGSIIILEEALEQESIQSHTGRVRSQVTLVEPDATFDELEKTPGTTSDQAECDRLRHEIDRLKEMIERLCKETKSQ